MDTAVVAMKFNPGKFSQLGGLYGQEKGVYASVYVCVFVWGGGLGRVFWGGCVLVVLMVGVLFCVVVGGRSGQLQPAEEPQGALLRSVQVRGRTSAAFAAPRRSICLLHQHRDSWPVFLRGGRGTGGGPFPLRGYTARWPLREGQAADAVRWKGRPCGKESGGTLLLSAGALVPLLADCGVC